MLFESDFNDDVMQVDHFEFDVHQKKCIHICLQEGEFQHFFVIIKNPKKEVKAVLTFKTRLYDYYLANEPYYSNNTMPCEIVNGVWSIDVVRTYPIKNGYKIQVDFEDIPCEEEKMTQNPLIASMNTVFNKQTGWYKGDLHLHSHYSDGRITLEDIDKQCKNLELDYIALTDHSIFTTKYPLSNYLVIPGTEITWDDLGHYNVWGIQDFIDYGYFVKKAKNKDEALNILFHDLKQKNAFLSFNHPFPYGWNLGHDFDINQFDTIEVINAPHLIIPELNNEKAIHFFDYLWNNDLLLYGVGGSDAHKKNYFETYPVGIPTTKVYCEQLTTRNLLTNLQQGHSYIYSDSEFEVAFYQGNDLKNIVIPGTKMMGSVNMVARCKESVTWELIHNGEVICQNKGKLFNQIITIHSDEYYRLQARKDGEVILFINPIHNKTRRTDVVMLQTLLSEFYKEYKC